MWYIFFQYSYKSEQKVDEIKNNVFIIKWDKRQGRKSINEKWKQKKSLCLTFFSSRKKKKTYESERWLQFVKKLKNTIRMKIKIILINIWFNYSFDSWFFLNVKLVLQFILVSILSRLFKKLIQFGILSISLNLLKRINDFFIKIETFNMDDLLCWCN